MTTLLAASAPVTATPPRAQPDDRRPPRILYADDDPMLMKFGKALLSSAGYEVDTAEDGAAAWQALNGTEYQLLVTDHIMPGLTGLDLITQARVSGLCLPIVLTSGSLLGLPDLGGVPAGRTVFLAKPFASGELLETVARLLEAANSGSQRSAALISNLASRVPTPLYQRWGLNE